MKRFQQWQDNQTYFTHLTNLNIIRCRKTPGTTNGRRRVVKENRSLSQEEIHKANERMVRRIENPKRIAICSTSDYFKPSFSKQKYKVQEKNLSYENLLFGRRILEVEPVISASKLKRQYRERKGGRLLKTTSTNSHIRTNKLIEFINKEECSTYLKGIGGHVLKLRILGLEFHKLKIRDDDIHHISLAVQMGRTVRRSELIPIKEVTSRDLCFRFKKKYCPDGCVRASIRYHNGILDTQLGYFDFSIGYYLQGEETRGEEKAPIYKRVGAYGGEVTFRTEAYRLQTECTNPH